METVVQDLACTSGKDCGTEHCGEDLRLFEDTSGEDEICSRMKAVWL